MTPEERFFEIESRNMHSLAPSDINWLISRVKELTEAAEQVLSQFKYHGTTLDNLRKALTGSKPELKVGDLMEDNCEQCCDYRCECSCHRYEQSRG